MIQAEIKEDIKKAMKAKDSLRLSVLRSLSASFTNETIAKGKKPDESLADADALAVIKRASNQRKDAISQFRDGGREDLAVGEEAELQILMEYLPTQMSEEEIRKVVEEKKASLNIDDKAKMGILIGAVMKEVGEKADGSAVKKIVEEVL